MHPQHFLSRLALLVSASAALVSCSHSGGRASSADTSIPGRGSAESGGRLALAQKYLAEAEKIRGRHPSRGLGLYLEVASAFKDGAAKSDLYALPIYNRAAAAAAELAFLLRGDSPPKLTAPGPESPWEISLILPTIGEDPGATIDSITSSYTIEKPKGKNRKLRSHNVRAGVGGTLAAFQRPSPKSRLANPFIPSIGRSIPVTAIVDFPSPRQAEIRVLESNLSENATLAGKKVPLSADFSAALARLIEEAPKENIGFKAMCHPFDHLADAGIYMVEPFQPGKIPVVLVHGLKKDPSTWRNTYNDLIVDPEIRKHFQFWFFRYPSGFPLLYSSALLRRHLDDVHAWAAENGGGREIENMVLVGHSMGGVLCRIRVSAGADTLQKRFFTKPVEELGLSDKDRRSIDDLMFLEPSPFVTRAVFVCTPHRGSEQAKGIIGATGNLLIDLSKSVTTLSFLNLRKRPYEGFFTPLGRAVILSPADGVRSLAPDDPTLLEIAKLPFAKGVTYHSIIGDQGKGGPVESSSDSVVDYKSSHLEGAASEKIIPSDHLGHDHPEGIEEIRRILLEHLSKSGFR